MEENTGFYAYSLFSALKLHFTTESYDFVKYRGIVNLTKDNFEKRKDKWSFYKLSRKYSVVDLKDFYIANFIYGSTTWIKDIASKDGDDVYKKWKSINESLSYKVKEDFVYLLNKYEKPEVLLRVDNGQLPVLLEESISNTIAFETLVILEDILKFFKMWKQKIIDDVIWVKYETKAIKYTPFIRYDKDSIKKTLKDLL